MSIKRIIVATILALLAIGSVTFLSYLALAPWLHTIDNNLGWYSVPGLVYGLFFGLVLKPGQYLQLASNWQVLVIRHHNYTSSPAIEAPSTHKS